MMPDNLRTTGFSLAYSFATALFDGFTSAVSTWLIAVTGGQSIARTLAHRCRGYGRKRRPPNYSRIASAGSIHG